MQCICEAKFTLEKVIFRMDLMLQVKNPFKECKGLPKKMPFRKKITKMQKNLVKLPYSAEKNATESLKPSTVLCFDLLIFQQACFSKQGCGID